MWTCLLLLPVVGAEVVSVSFQGVSGSWHGPLDANHIPPQLPPLLPLTEPDSYTYVTGDTQTSHILASRAYSVQRIDARVHNVDTSELCPLLSNKGAFRQHLVARYLGGRTVPTQCIKVGELNFSTPITKGAPLQQRDRRQLAGFNDSNVQVLGDSVVWSVSQLINITSGVSTVNILESFVEIRIQSQVSRKLLSKSTHPSLRHRTGLGRAHRSACFDCQHDYRTAIRHHKHHGHDE